MRDIALVRYLPSHPKVPFMGVRKLTAILSIFAIIASVFLFTSRGLNYGIDFTGGTVLEVDTGGEPALEDIRAAVGSLDLGAPALQLIRPPADAGVDHDYVRITVPLQEEGKEGAKVQQEALIKVQSAVKGVVGDYVLRGQDVVGSKVSGELREKGILAIVLALGMVLIYIWFRFEWQFAVGAVMALFHDVLLTIGVFSLVQIEFNLSIIAAILTIVGYSLNDTVIVYDRIRENMRKYKKMPMAQLLNLSINDTLSRTIMTSFTTMLALLSLFILGGEGLRGFSFAMIWGIFVGTYSSIFVASPLLLLFGLHRHDAPPLPKSEAEAQKSLSEDSA